MRFPIWIGAVVCMAAVSPLKAACGKTAVMSATGADGRKVELVLDSAIVERTPKWSPGAGEPPLSLTRATKAASAWAKKRYSRFDVVEIREVSLTSLGCTSSRNHWYYVFDFAPIMDGNRMYGSGNWAAVLMDGTIIGATQAGSNSN